MPEESINADGAFYLKPGGAMEGMNPTDLTPQQYVEASGIDRFGYTTRMPGKRLSQLYPGPVTQIAAFGTGVFIQQGATLYYYPDVSVLVPSVPVVIPPSPTLTPTSVALVSSANPVVAGADITFTAEVAPSTATGTIVFSTSGTILATVALVGGIATCDVTTLPVGTDGILAVYSGDTVYATSSTELAQVVTSVPTSPSLIATTLLVVSSLNPSGQALEAYAQITVTILVDGVTPSDLTGVVDLLNSYEDTIIGTVTLDTGGQASFTPGLESMANFNASHGTYLTYYNLIAVYSGDSKYAASEGGIQQVVNEAVISTTMGPVTSSANPSVSGTSITLTATLEYEAYQIHPYPVESTDPVLVGGDAGYGYFIPKGVITFYQGSTVLGIANPISTATNPGVTPATSSVATLGLSTLPVGTDSITAVFAGDGAYLPCTTSAALAQVVTAPTGGSTDFTYVSDGDTNGLFYYLGTNLGTTAWSNPVDNGSGLTITLSPGLSWSGSPDLLTNRTFDGVFTSPPSSFTDQGIIFTLPAGHQLTLTNVSYQTWIYNSSVPNTLTVEGSNDGSTWVTLGNSGASGSISTTPATWNLIPITGAAAYSMFRFTTPLNNNSENGYFTGSEYELYGNYA